MAHCLLSIILFTIVSIATPLHRVNEHGFRKFPRFLNTTAISTVASTGAGQQESTTPSLQVPTSATAHAAFAASDQPALTAITPVEIATYVSSYAALTFINTAGQAIFTETAGVYEGTSFIPQTSEPTPSIVVSSPVTTAPAASSMIASAVTPSLEPVPSSALLPISVYLGRPTSVQQSPVKSNAAKPSTGVQQIQESTLGIALPSTIANGSPSTTGLAPTLQSPVLALPNTSVLRPSSVDTSAHFTPETSVQLLRPTLALPSTIVTLESSRLRTNTFVRASPTSGYVKSSQPAVSQAQTSQVVVASSYVLGSTQAIPAQPTTLNTNQTVASPTSTHHRSTLTIRTTITRYPLSAVSTTPSLVAPSPKETAYTLLPEALSTPTAQSQPFPTFHTTLRGYGGSTLSPTAPDSSVLPTSAGYALPNSEANFSETGPATNVIETPPAGLAQTEPTAPSYRLVLTASPSLNAGFSSGLQLPEAASLGLAVPPGTGAGRITLGSSKQAVPTALPATYTNHASLLMGNANAVSSEAPAWSIVPVDLSHSGVSYIYITVTETVARETVTQTQTVTATLH